MATIVSASWELEKLLSVDWPELKRAAVHGPNGGSVVFGDVYVPADWHTKSALHSRTLVVMVPSHTREAFVRSLKYSMYAEAINTKADILFVFDASVRPHEAAIFLEELRLIGRADYIRWCIDTEGKVFRTFSPKRSLRDSLVAFTRKSAKNSALLGGTEMPHRELNFVLLEFGSMSAPFRPSLACALLEREVYGDSCAVLLALSRALDIDVPPELLARDEELVEDYQKSRTQSMNSRDLLRSSSGRWAGSRGSWSRLNYSAPRTKSADCSSIATMNSFSPPRVDARGKLAAGDIKPRHRTKSSSTVISEKQKLALRGLVRTRSVTRPECGHSGPIERVDLAALAF